MSFQRWFRRFHETIRLRPPGENAALREQRDRVLRRLREGLQRSFTWFEQGSHAMDTGIEPLHGDYDIDIAIVFDDVYTDEHDPVEVKRWVYEAMLGHAASVEWRPPCITVFYREPGEAVYHIDVAVFARDRASHAEHLAIGKRHAAGAQRAWLADDRKRFMAAMQSRYPGDDGEQFRRVIRYLKRWRDVHFPVQGYAAPTGLALTVAAYSWFQPARDREGDQDDLAATHALVRRMLQGFTRSAIDDPVRLRLAFPCLPHDDVFIHMDDPQMQGFHHRLQQLDQWLGDARRSGDASLLARAFGPDFPGA